MAGRSTAIAIPPSIIAMSVAGSNLPLAMLLSDMDIVMTQGSTAENDEKQGPLCRGGIILRRREP